MDRTPPQDRPCGADRIRIADLEVFANHGVFPEENVLGQKFLVSLDLELDLSRAGLSDALEDSVSYAEVCQRVDRLLRENTYKLLERAAQAVADDVLAAYPLVERVTVEIKKPWAPVGLPLSYVSVAITRAR